MKSKRNKKELIIIKAMELFQKESFEKVKITDICKACNLSVGGFYHYFASKQDLLDNVYIRFDEVLSEELNNNTFSSYLEEILFIIHFELDYGTREGVFIPAITFQQQLSQKHPYAIEKNRLIYKYLKELFEKGIKHNEFTTTIDTDELIEWILRTSRGVIYDWCLRNGTYDVVNQGLHDVSFILNHCVTLIK